MSELIDHGPLAYRSEGRLLTIVVRGAPDELDRARFFRAIAEDPNVPDGAVVLIDGSRSDQAASVVDLRERASRLVALLGPKLGPVVAVIAPPRLAMDAAVFQVTSRRIGLQVAVFADELSARDYLRAHVDAP